MDFPDAAEYAPVDPMYMIIEAAYHCAHTMDQIHAAIAKAGLPETSDETIMLLLGEYSAILEV